MPDATPGKVVTWLSMMPSPTRAARRVAPNASSPAADHGHLLGARHLAARRAQARPGWRPAAGNGSESAARQGFAGRGMRGTRKTRSILMLPITTIMMSFPSVQLQEKK
jgi:hypothetical protein